MQTYTQLTNKEIEKVLEFSGKIELRIRFLWEIFKDLEGDKDFEKLVRRVKYGFNVWFDIRLITEGEVEPYYDSMNIRIRGMKKMPIQVYWDELEKREKKMKEVIRELYDEGSQSRMEVKGYERFKGN